MSLRVTPIQDRIKCRCEPLLLKIGSRCRFLASSQSVHFRSDVVLLVLLFIYLSEGVEVAV